MPAIRLGHMMRTARYDEPGNSRHPAQHLPPRPRPQVKHNLVTVPIFPASFCLKSQGSEYPAVILPMHTQAYMLLQRNLLYTAITGGRELVVIVGSKKAVAMAVKRVDSRRQVTTLRERLA